MKFGQRIKLQRLKRHMTQQQLAENICSTSYLSKIEKGHVIPKHEIQQALLNRLEIHEPLIKLDEQTFMENIQAAYRAVLAIQTKTHARIAFNTFSSTQIVLENKENFYIANLYLLYFSLIAEEPPDNIQHLSDGILAIKDKFTPYQKFLYNAISSKFFYEKKQYEEAKNAIFEALRIKNSITIEDMEYGALLELEGSIHFHLYEQGNAFSRLRAALDIFLNNHAHEKILSTYNFLGLINLQFGNYDFALKFLNTGYNYAIQLAKKHHYGPLLQNIGYTYARMNQPKRAIDYYRRSLNNTIEPFKKLTTIHAVVREYSKENQAEQVAKWCAYGLELITAHHLDQAAKSYYYHFHIYTMVHKLEQFNIACFEQAIQHFSVLKDYHNVQKYAFVLAQKYEQTEQYEDAVIYYRIANEASCSVRAIRDWQDL